MIELLHPEIRVLSRQRAATESQIAVLKERHPELPEALAELMREATEIELSYRGRYMRLYGPTGCIEIDDAYGIARQIPSAIVVGDNGGEALILIRERLYRVGYGALAPDELKYVADSIRQLLILAEPTPDAVGGCEA
jgi:hypothetical protein